MGSKRLYLSAVFVTVCSCASPADARLISVPGARPFGLGFNFDEILNSDTNYPSHGVIRQQSSGAPGCLGQKPMPKVWNT